MDIVTLHLGNCNFERDKCGYYRDTNRWKANFDWLVGSGGTMSMHTGPSVDHSTGTKHGRST